MSVRTARDTGVMALQADINLFPYQHAKIATSWKSCCSNRVPFSFAPEAICCVSSRHRLGWYRALWESVNCQTCAVWVIDIVGKVNTASRVITQRSRRVSPCSSFDSTTMMLMRLKNGKMTATWKKTGSSRRMMEVRIPTRAKFVWLPG